MGSTLILWSHQLHPQYVAEARINPKQDDIVLVDSTDQWTYYHFHKQRIVLHLSAMHHYVASLKQAGWRAKVIQAPTFLQAVQSIPNRIMFEPTNHYEQAWVEALKPLTLLKDPIFLIDTQTWPTLLPKHKPWKLDPLYRQFRQQFNVLMDQDQPVGGQYSFDSDNRKPPTDDLTFIQPLWFTPDTITRQQIQDVLLRFPTHPGTLDTFAYPVTREQALESLSHFLTFRLPTFGDHQDAMLSDQPWMSHSLISSSLNLGLLSPLEVIQSAEKQYQLGQAPLAATEGFIRQILGWREYVRGVYLVLGPSYLSVNHFQHERPLPDFYYSGDTAMQCLNTTIHETIHHAYNHHIQRLMVLSNYANLAEVKPQDLNRWFNEMYIDSAEWVVAANVLGMGLHADGGKMATKPYIASGAYIHKMSNYCDQCAYQVTLKTGDKACPFNALYWHYIASKKTLLKNNPRMGMMIRVWEKMDPEDQQALLKQARKHLS